MQRVNEFDLYELATKVHSLAELGDAPFKYGESWQLLWNARLSVDQLYTQRPLNFTTPSALRLYGAISAIVPDSFDEVVSTWAAKTQPDVDVIPPYRVVEVRDAAKEFEAMLRTECQLMDTYFISKKGAYSTKDLLDNFHHQIPEPSRSKLPAQAKADFDQAGRCIAFDVATAAAFHLLRGTEAIIREYYNLIVPGIKQVSNKMRNWGVYIKLISSCGGDSDVIKLLDHMREVYRNPVTHPEENYTDDKVQVLLGLCISATVLLVQAIDKISAKGGVLNFPPPPPSSPALL